MCCVGEGPNVVILQVHCFITGGVAVFCLDDPCIRTWMVKTGILFGTLRDCFQCTFAFSLHKYSYLGFLCEIFETVKGESI